MHQARPFGRFGDVQTQDDAYAIERLARRLTNIKDLSGVDSLRMVHTLPSGLLAIAQDMGGVFKVFVQQPDLPHEPEFDGVASTAGIPMLFSGRITKSRVREKEPVEMVITPLTRRRLKGFKKDEMAPEQLQLQRFRIEHGPAFSEFQGEPGVFTNTQYTNQHPTWHSGAMAEVVQIVAGYGRRDEKLPAWPVPEGEPTDPMREYERKQMKLPDKWQAKLDLEAINVRLPGYSGMTPKEGQLQFDYKVNRTHGVGFDTDKKPWLIQVAPGGVHAMPLPLVPATTTKTFRAYIEEVGDDEVLWALDRFGGLPSGEGFPSTTKGGFDAWKRAGAIVKVCEVGDFYQHISYSSACGWSFSSKGTEGFNTCYDYDDEEGLGYGLAYKLSLRLGVAKDDGKLPASFHLKDADDARLLDKYLGLLYKTMGMDSSAKHLAIKYKLRRVPIADILQRGEGYFKFLSEGDTGQRGQAELDYWDGLEIDPIATHSGNINRVGRGWLYHGAKHLYQPQIKYPEPFMGGCISHDFLPLSHGRGKAQYPECDTIMFGYYIGDQLKTVKYFRDGRTFNKDVEDDFEQCMIVGSWQRTTALSPAGLRGHFYTSDFDDRSDDIASFKTEKIVGQDLGYDHTPWFSFDAPFWRPGTMWRNRYFTHKTNTKTTSDSAGESGLCIPYLNRNALLYATRESSRETAVESFALHSMQDPNTYRYWTYDFVMHWAGSIPVMNGKPYPKNGNPVWVEMHEYNPGPCTDFADRGDWVGALPANYQWLIHPQANVWMLSGGGGAPSVKGYVRPTPTEEKKAAELQVSILAQTGKVHKAPAVTYFLGSPGEFGDVFYRDACKVLAGKATYANVMEDDPEAPKQRKRFGHTRMADHKGAHFFIGVINE